MQFHGDLHKKYSCTINGALYSRSTRKILKGKEEWMKILKQVADALSHIHKMGFLHNDLKENNIVLDKRDNEITAVIIDFGKSRPISSPRGPKKLSISEQENYKTKYPHIDPQIVEGKSGETITSDTFLRLAGKIANMCNFELPDIFARSLDPKERATLQQLISVL
ncbi:hypothetical protein QZH41_007153 [Actinostola sp. cb2023]|nr:hypothetical protein QZH41_007153 [Actinostola sp. cb2023]